MNLKRPAPVEISMEQARVNLSAMVQHVKYLRREFVIMRHGKPAARVVPIDGVEANPDAMLDLKVLGKVPSESSAA